MLHRSVLSISLFIFSSLSLVFGVGIGVLFGPVFLVPASLLFVIGIIFSVKFYQTSRDRYETTAKIFRVKNILFFLLLFVLGMLFLNGLSSVWPFFFKNTKDAFAFGEMTGGLFMSVLATIGIYFITRKIFHNNPDL